MAGCKYSPHPCVTPAGVLCSFLNHFPTAPAVGYVVTSLRDSQLHKITPLRIMLPPCLMLEFGYTAVSILVPLGTCTSENDWRNSRPDQDRVRAQLLH